MNRWVLSEKAEQAQTSLSQSYASYTIWRRMDALRTLPRLWGARRSFDRAHLGAHATVAHMVSIAEHLSVSLFAESMDAEVPFGPAVASKMWAALQTRIESTWDSQNAAWRTYRGINVKGADQYDALRPFIDARNSIVHGAGRLTRRQQVDSVVGPRLLAAGMSIAEGSLLIEDPVVAQCGERCRSFVVWLDLRNQGRELASSQAHRGLAVK